MNYIKSNTGFIISLIVLAIIAFNPEAKSFVLQGLIKTGLYQPAYKQAAIENRVMAPAAVFRSAEGGMIDIANHKGKVIFLNFWAEWCPPCLAEMPSINKLAGQFANEQDLVFLMANVDGELQSSEAFFKKKNYKLSAFIPAGAIPEGIFQGSLPTTLIINKKGEVVYKHEGIADYGTATTWEFIEGLLKQ